MGGVEFVDHVLHAGAGLPYGDFRAIGASVSQSWEFAVRVDGLGVPFGFVLAF